jgi:hypothetical protein
MPDVSGGMPDYARIASELNRLTEENLKLLAERHKLEAEALKLGSERVKPDAEAVKFRREGWFYPVLAVGGFVGGIIAGVTAILRLIAGQP